MSVQEHHRNPHSETTLCLSESNHETPAKNPQLSHFASQSMLYAPEPRPNTTSSHNRDPLPPPSESFTFEEGPAFKEPPSPNEVNWDSDTDSADPMNWTGAEKWRNLGIIALMSLSTPLASSMFAPSVPQALEDFHSTNTFLGTIVISIFILGFAIGPLAIAPLSEIYGRRPIYVISIFVFTIFTMACALAPSLSVLIVFRFFAGCAGSTTITLGGASIGDMFSEDKRGAAMAIWGMGPLLGPVLGPIIGGYLSAAGGWRWIFWAQTILAGTLLILGAVFLKETYAVVLLELKAKNLRKSTGNTQLRSALYDGLTGNERMKRSIIRPVKILFMSPVVLLLSIYISFLFGYVYLLITTFPLVFSEQYGFSTGSTGLTYLGLGAGFVIGLGVAGKTCDPIYKRLEKRNGGVGKPEFTIPLLNFSAPIICVAFLWYGWSADQKVQWIVPILGTVVFGIGMMPTAMVVNMYLVQAYGRYSASAIAASKVLQSLGGAFLPLAGPPLYAKLGLGWGNSVLAFLALLFVPLPWFFFRYGETLRKKCVVKI